MVPDDSNNPSTDAFTAFTGASIVSPPGQVTVDAGGVVLPIQNGDNVMLLGLSSNSQSLEWNNDESGVLTIVVPQDQVDQVDYAWAFQVTYSG
jgi:alpha-L-fucosidase